MKLIDKIIISTRPAGQDDELKEHLSARGAKVLDAPLIEAVCADIDDHINKILSGISEFDRLVFTSKNGVRCFFVLLDKLGINLQNLSGTKIAVFGSKSATELRKHLIEPEYVSTANSSDKFLEEFKEHISLNDKVLLALGNLAKDTLYNGLADMHTVERINVYRTLDAENIPGEIQDIIKAGSYDIIIFTSPSGFRNFIKIMNENGITGDFKIACIGSVTAKEVTDLGYTPVLVSSKPDAKTFADEIENYFSSAIF